ncbi:MAG: NUDIX hydrolase [Bacteroidetes bacterium]|nr:NUDIX hydrolase [Bacteroidota bacterium]
MSLPPDWHILESIYLHQEPWLTVRRDSLQLPNGHTIPNYFVLEYPDWVNVIAITNDNKLVLVKQYRHALSDTHFELCAGVIESNETPLDAAKRELKEETGFTGGTWSLLMKSTPNPATSNNWVYCFLAKNVIAGEASPEESECLTIHEFSKEEIIQLIIEEKIVQSTHLAPLWKWIAQNQ